MRTRTKLFVIRIKNPAHPYKATVVRNSEISQISSKPVGTSHIAISEKSLSAIPQSKMPDFLQHSSMHQILESTNANGGVEPNTIKNRSAVENDFIEFFRGLPGENNPSFKAISQLNDLNLSWVDISHLVALFIQSWKQKSLGPNGMVQLYGVQTVKPAFQIS